MQRRKRERVRQHIRGIPKWYARSTRYRRSAEALLQYAVHELKRC